MGQVRDWGRDERGLTLTEVVMFVGAATLLSSAIVAALYGVLTLPNSWQPRVLATKDIRNAESWVATDVANALSTSLVDGGSTSTQATLSWTDGGGFAHDATYTLAQDGDLLRGLDGTVTTTVARGVTDASFGLLDGSVTFAITVASSPGQTRSSTLITNLMASN
jgi:hypothetical protein